MRDLIHQLTRTHYLDGKMHEALLTQIEGAAQPDRTGGASAGNDEPKVPVDVGAISIRQNIDWEARDYHYSLYGTDTGTLTEIIQAFGSTKNPEWAKYLEGKLGGWANSIRSYLHPTKPRYKINAPCPACGQRFYGEDRRIALSANCWDKDENLLPPGEWEVACAACPGEWRGEELSWFTQIIAA